MSGINDYLTKQLFIEKNVVSYRSLSRQFNIHVNAAKNELATYYDSTKESSNERAYATYLITGEMPSQPRPDHTPNGTQSTNGMDVDSEAGRTQSVDSEGVEEVEIIPQTKVTLAGEKDRESVKARYTRIYSEHVYCLSPAPLVDAGIIYTPTAQVYQADAKLTPDASVLLGRVVGSDVHVGKVSKPKASSKVKEPVLLKSGPTLKNKKRPVKEEEKEPSPPIKAEQHEKLVPKAKSTGKLDWSKAKPKVKEEQRPTKLKETGSKNAKRKTSPAREKPKAKGSSSSAETKRGIKRKSALPTFSDSEDDTSPSQSSPPPLPASRTGPKIRKAIVLSDEEEEDEEMASQKAPAKGRAKAMVTESSRVHKETEVEQSLKAMMDIDDDQVIRASRLSRDSSHSQAEESENVDEDVDMVAEEEDLTVKPKPKRKREKKVVPVGRNGLKKKRVVKSRMTTDEKGYLITEDYSSYESVDEEEVEPPKKGRSQKTAPAKSKKTGGSPPDTKSSKSGPASKASKGSGSLKRSSSSGGSKGGGRGNLMNFFEKK